jgi:hypothetical protein
MYMEPCGGCVLPKAGSQFLGESDSAEREEMARQETVAGYEKEVWVEHNLRESAEVSAQRRRQIRRG